MLLFLMASSTLVAQQQQITLEEIWSGKFSTEGLDVLRSLKNGKEYAVLNFNRHNRSTMVVVYDYKSGEKVRILLNTATMNGIDHMVSYQFNSDESQIL